MSEPNILNALLQAQTQLESQPEEEQGIFLIRSANQTLEEASKRPDPAPLWKSLWYEGELSCLFSDSNLGKSIYAVQIAEEVSKTGRSVIYFDFEQSDKQFQLRYTDNSQHLHVFPNSFYRAELGYTYMDSETIEETIMQGLEDAISQVDAKILIIDNLTFLCTATESGDIAGSLMRHFKNFAKKNKLSILIIAHTPKRDMSQPITQNDLAGSKKLFNFFDSVFAIGKSAQAENIRYIKQIKVRHGQYEFGQNNVIVCEIRKEDSMTALVEIGTGKEKEHLKAYQENKEIMEEELKQITALQQQGKNQREIAKLLNMSQATVNRRIKNNNKI